MDVEQIQKSRLYRESYLPGGVARLRNQANARVEGARNNEVALDGIDRDQLVDTAKRFVADWESLGGTVDEVLRDVIRSGRLVVQSPSEVYVSPYPLLLRCDICSVIDFYDPRLKQDRLYSALLRRIRGPKGRTFISCKRTGCGGHMHQIPHVAVHRCGFIAPIHVPHTARRKENIGFRDVGGAFFYNSFFDVDTGERLAGALQEDCPSCSREFAGAAETNERGTPVTSGESYYSQVIQYIALSKTVGGLVSQLHAQVAATHGVIAGLTADVAEGVTSALLGCTDSRELERQLRSLLNTETPSEASMQAVRDELEKKLKVQAKYASLAKGDDDIAELLSSTTHRIDELRELLEQASGRFRSVRDLVSDDATLSAIVGQRRSMEAVLLRHDVQSTSVQQASVETSDHVVREARNEQWNMLQNRYGLASIAHIPDLLVVLSAVGFTRERRLPGTDPGVTPVRLNAFEDTHDDSLRGKVALYAMSARTEALWIRLNPSRVLRWCVESAGWARPELAVLDNPQAAHAFLLMNSSALTLPPGEVVKNTKDRPPRESAPFHLLHSICHTLLATARRHTGYDDKSLMEYMFPMDLSFLVYVTSVQNYTSGGLLTLFQHYLGSWFDDASLYAFNCAFDPICSDTGGSCSGCIQTVIGCETFNHGLSRAYLHGGNVDRDHAMTLTRGFWDGRS